MQIVVVLFVVLMILSTLLQWSCLLAMDQDIRRMQQTWQNVTIVKRSPHEIGETHPFTPDATVNARDILNDGPFLGYYPQREVVESSP